MPFAARGLHTAREVVPWQPKIDKHEHPFGEAGTRKSLDAVAKKIKEGYTDPRVRAWAIECLERARREEGIACDTERERAEVLLRAVQKKLWVPDATATEWIAGAHLTLCVDKNAPCFHGGDCFPHDTTIYKRNKNCVISSLRVGDEIWGFDRWSKVEAVVCKGVLPVDVLTLSNGEELHLTEEHHVYDTEKRRHRVKDVDVGFKLLEPSVVGGMSDRVMWQPEVISIERAAYETECWDIQTDDHMVYMPDALVTVAQCDDLSVALGSAAMSVGLWVCVVGHSYNTRKDLEHVLTSIRVGGEWKYADPSTSWELGRCAKFSRERVLSVPDVRVLCDGDICFRNPKQWDPIQEGFVSRGTYVGVDGVPKFAWLEAEPSPRGYFEWLGQEPPPEEEIVKEEKKIEKTAKGLSMEGKLLLAGFALNAVALGWQIYSYQMEKERRARPQRS